MGLPLKQRWETSAELGRQRLRSDPEGAKNVEVAKDFLRFFIKPKGQQRVAENRARPEYSVLPSVVKDDPWWMKEDPHRVRTSSRACSGRHCRNSGPSNPAYAQLQNEHTWSTGWMDIIRAE